MVEYDFDVNVWEKNSIIIFAIQGESDSRLIRFHLKQNVQVQNARGEMELQPKPVDISEYTSLPRIGIIKSDGTKSFNDGEIVDATNGVISFLLAYQATTAINDNACQVFLAKPSGATLKVDGITITVMPSNFEGAIQSTDDFSALIKALNKADTAAATAQQAAADAQQADAKANDAVVAANQAKAISDESAQDAKDAAAQARQAAQDALNSHSMISPVTHYSEPIEKIINDLFATMSALGGGAPTAAEYAALGLTAEQYAAKGLNAAQYAMAGKTMLGG
ncbi:MAG TPA: BppU family phage baseplate upper protein [Caproicibacter sp.]|nr:BppU family phage baseplate upper protein [Caproicibacter sp.]